MKLNDKWGSFDSVNFLYFFELMVLAELQIGFC